MAVKKIDSELRCSDKTVYILGAGFSRLTGTPTLDKFIPQAFYILKKHYEQDWAKKFAEIINKYSKIASVIGIDLDNLEDLFCLVDLPVQKKEERIQWYDRNVLINVIIKTIIFAKEDKCDSKGKMDKEKDKISKDEECWVSHSYLYSDFKKKTDKEKDNKKKDNKENKNTNGCTIDKSFGVCVYEAFLSYILHCQNNKGNNNKNNENDNTKAIKNVYDLDTIITLNWDLTIEDIVRNIEGANIFYGENILDKKLRDNDIINNHSGNISNNTFHILKLHGSFNWLCNENNYQMVNEIDWKMRGQLDNRKNKNNKKIVPIIPPTWKRSSNTEDIFSKMAGQAIFHLRCASKIVVIGCSMPSTDVYFKYMLAKGLSTAEFPEIQVWDVQPKDVMLQKMEEIFGKKNVEKERVKYFNSGLIGFVKSHPREL